VLIVTKVKLKLIACLCWSALLDYFSVRFLGNQTEKVTVW
jgi:hypothetical protein